MKCNVNKIFYFVFLILFSAKFFKLHAMENTVQEEEHFLEKPLEVSLIEPRINEIDVSHPAIISKANKLKACKIAYSKVCSCICDQGFKTLVICFMAAQIIVLYFLINQLLDGCDNMKEKCNTCADELTQCEEAYKMTKSLAEFALKLWNNCPTGDQDIIDALEQFKSDCCNETGARPVEFYGTGS